eukprot:m51a1_g13612 putative pas domain-containing protein tyrosine kinase (527) ;mRNA; r:174-1925
MGNATVEHVEDADAFVFVGGPAAAADFLDLLFTDSRQLNKTKVMCSEVPDDLLQDELGYFAPLEELTGVHLLSKTPPLSTLHKNNEVRQMYEQWLSEIDRGESSFRGFFVGMFLSAVIDAIDDDALANGGESLVTSELIVRTIYHIGIFDIGSITVGPFVDKCEGSVRCCNQGLDKVYIILVYMHTKRTLSFLNIKRPDLEINECIGKGRCGPLHVGDWHGTTVAIRVIDKREVSKGDLATIKEEIGLLHKLHHPNLLMLMGYCETRKELFVVSEYMSGGSLKEYLARNRGQLGVFSLIAMAFDVVKGIAYLHASKPPIVHGSISTRSLLVDDKLTTKVSDFWLSRSDRKRARLSLSTSVRLQEHEWLSPEVASGLLTPASDVWAFGVVLCELFQDRTPHRESSSQDLRSSSGSLSMSMTQMAQHPEPDASTPQEVVELMFQCWEPQPDQRPTIFTVLRSWPSTFAAVGRFELPADLSQVQITEDSSRTSGTGPDAVVPVAMMSHSEREAAQSLHFEFRESSEPAH